MADTRAGAKLLSGRWGGGLLPVFVLAGWVLCSSGTAMAQATPLFASGAVGWRPYVMNDPEIGRLTGVFMDLLEMVSHETGLDIRFRDLSWKRALQQLKQGDLDIICGMYRTSEREAVYRFSPPLFRDEVRIFTARPLQVDSLDDLVGLQGDIPLGARYGEPFDSYAKQKLRLDRVSDKRYSFGKLMHERTDYVISAYADGVLELALMGLSDAIRPLPFVVAVNDVYWAYPLSRGRQQDYDRVDAVLRRLVANGTVERLYSMHLHRGIERDLLDKRQSAGHEAE